MSSFGDKMQRYKAGSYCHQPHYLLQIREVPKALRRTEGLGDQGRLCRGKFGSNLERMLHAHKHTGYRAERESEKGREKEKGVAEDRFRVYGVPDPVFYIVVLVFFCFILTRTSSPTSLQII